MTMGNDDEGRRRGTTTRDDYEGRRPDEKREREICNLLWLQSLVTEHTLSLVSTCRLVTLTPIHIISRGPALPCMPCHVLPCPCPALPCPALPCTPQPCLT